MFAPRLRRSAFAAAVPCNHLVERVRGARVGSSGEMFFSKVIRLVTIVLRHCGEMFFLELHHLVNLGTNGLLGCGLALVRAMALKTLISDFGRLPQKGYDCW